MVQVFRFGGLGDAVSGAHIVQQEVAIGMDDRTAQELRDFVRTAVDARSWRQSLVGWDVANCAADLSEEHFSGVGGGACGEVGVAGWRACVADFIYQAFQFGLVRLGVRRVEGGGDVAGRVRRIFFRVKAIAHAEFVAQRVGAGGHQAAVLTLPAEAAYLQFGRRTACFENRGANNDARDTKIRLALLLKILFDVPAADGFNVAVAQQIEGDSFAADLLR